MNRLDAGRIGDAGKIGRANETEHDRWRVCHFARGVHSDLRHLGRDDQHRVHAAIKRVFYHEVGSGRVGAGVAPEHIHIFAEHVLARIQHSAFFFAEISISLEDIECAFGGQSLPGGIAEIHHGNRGYVIILRQRRTCNQRQYHN